MLVSTSSIFGHRKIDTSERSREVKKGKSYLTVLIFVECPTKHRPRVIDLRVPDVENPLCLNSSLGSRDPPSQYVLHHGN